MHSHIIWLQLFKYHISQWYCAKMRGSHWSKCKIVDLYALTYQMQLKKKTLAALKEQSGLKMLKVHQYI